MAYDPNVICFSCKFGWGYASEKKPENEIPKNRIPVVCCGKVESTHILEAFKAGADGVLIFACQEGGCHYQDGNFQTSKKVYLLQKVLETFGLEQERVRVEMGLDPEGAKVEQLVKEMKQDLSKLGPAKRF
jgi:F420-non-reducing hydrogenase iron-sulfur subunit